MKPSVFVLTTLMLLCNIDAYGASINNAKSLYNDGDIDSALNEINKALKEQPLNADALLLKAQLQYKAGAENQAIVTYQSIIAQYPTRLQAYNNLAAIYAQHGNLQAATEILEKAIRLDPVYATIYDNLRATYWDMSKKHVRLALKLKPEKRSTKLIQLNPPLPDTYIDSSTGVAVTMVRPKKKAPPKGSEISNELKLNSIQQVEWAIKNWAKAWSNRNAIEYVAAYTAHYSPADKTRSEWIAGKRWNFKSKKFIKIDVDQLSVKSANGTYIATFRQSYESDLYKDKALKQLKLSKQDGLWKINDETTLKAL